MSVFLASCTSLAPDDPIPPQELPAAYRNTPPPQARTEGTAPEDASSGSSPQEGTGDDPPMPPDQAVLPTPPSQWWREFQAGELNDLVERALANNHDLKAAVSRIAQAQAQAGVQAGSLLPSLSFSGKQQTDSPTGGVGARYASPDGKSERSHQMGLTASYELDLWGKNQDAQRAALATAQASLFEREAVALTLVADTVAAYVQYLETAERVAIAEQNVRNMLQVLQVVQLRRQIGEGTDIEVSQQATALAQAKAVVPTLKTAMEQNRNQLALLVGELPERLRIKASSLTAVRLPALPPAIPSELLARRPDLRRSEAQLVSANAAIGQARAALLPSFSLNAEVGLGSAFLATLLNPQAYYYVIAANIAHVLFDNGRNLSQIDLQQAVYQEKVENYRQAVLTALADVENALTAVRQTAAQEQAQTEAWQHAVDAYNLSQAAFRIGTADYLTLLDTQRSRYQAEDDKAAARFQRLNAAISLYRALGGGTEESPRS